MEPLYRGHIRTLETVLYIEVVLNSEVIYSGISLNRTHWDLGNCPLYRGCPYFRGNIQWNLSIEDTLGPWKLSFI